MQASASTQVDASDNKLLSMRIESILLSYRVGGLSKQDAFNQIAQLLYRPLTSTLKNSFGVEDASAQDDLFQDVMCAFLVSEENPNVRFDPARGSFLSWIHQIARNTKADHLKRQSKQRNRFSSLSCEDEDKAWGLADHRFEQGLSPAALDVRNAVQKLPAADRELLHLKYGEGHTDKELAGLLEETIPNVKSLLREARKRFKKLLRPYKDPDPPDPQSPNDSPRGTRPPSQPSSGSSLFSVLYLYGGGKTRVSLLDEGASVMKITDDDAELYALFGEIRQASIEEITELREQRALFCFSVKLHAQTVPSPQWTVEQREHARGCDRCKQIVFPKGWVYKAYAGVFAAFAGGSLLAALWKFLGDTAQPRLWSHSVASLLIMLAINSTGDHRFAASTSKGHQQESRIAAAHSSGSCQSPATTMAFAQQHVSSEERKAATSDGVIRFMFDGSNAFTSVSLDNCCSAWSEVNTYDHAAIVSSVDSDMEKLHSWITFSDSLLPSSWKENGGPTPIQTKSVVDPSGRTLITWYTTAAATPSAPGQPVAWSLTVPNLEDELAFVRVWQAESNSRNVRWELTDSGSPSGTATSYYLPAVHRARSMPLLIDVEEALDLTPKNSARTNQQQMGLPVVVGPLGPPGPPSSKDTPLSMESSDLFLRGQLTDPSILFIPNLSDSWLTPPGRQFYSKVNLLCVFLQRDTSQVEGR